LKLQFKKYSSQIIFKQNKINLFCLLVCVFFIFPSSGHPQSLEELIAKTLSAHPSAQGQRELILSATAGVDSARWQYYPTPSVSVETANTAASDRLYQGDSSVSTVRLQQPLWTGGRLNAGMDKAKAGLVLSQASLEEVRLQLGLRVILAYGDWMSAYLKVLANEKSLATHVRLLEQVKRRLAEGAAAESDLTLAVARFEAISADITSARVQGEMALARLSQLVGESVKEARLVQFAALPRDLGTILNSKSNIQGLLSQAIDIHPTVLKAQAQARIQEAVIEERRSDLMPEVYARLERQYGNYNYTNIPPQNRFFVGLSSRFGAGLSTLSNVEAARTQHTAALAEIDTQSRTVTEQVLSDYALARSIDSRIVAIGASLKSAEGVSASYDRQYLAGRKSWLDVMNAARELAQTETQLAELKSTQLVVTWRLTAYARGIETLTEVFK